MNRIKFIACRLIIAFFVLASCFAIETLAQNSPKLPAGMKGSNADDPRSKLKSGLFDAEETALGMKHLLLFKKPEAFQLGAADLDNPRLKSALSYFGIGDPTQVPKPLAIMLAQLAFGNSDIAFQGNYLFQGNFYGMNIYDISKPSETKLLTSMVCPGGQGDVSVYKNLMFMSVEMPNGRLDCGVQGFAPVMPVAGEEPKPDVQKDRFRGVRIFDISDIRNPKQVGAVQTCRGSHTHTLVTDKNDKNNIYISLLSGIEIALTRNKEICPRIYAN